MGGYSNLGVASFISDAEIGRYCSIGARVSIGGYEHPLTWLGTASYQWGKSAGALVSENAFARLLSMPETEQLRTKVGSDVWIGDNVVLKRGVTVGLGAVVGSGSVVTKDVPDFAVVVGAPARVIQFRFDDDLRSRVLASQWWELDLEELSSLPLNAVEESLKLIGVRPAPLIT